jgi:hypothetical protein
VPDDAGSASDKFVRQSGTEPERTQQNPKQRELPGRFSSAMLSPQLGAQAMLINKRTFLGCELALRCEANLYGVTISDPAGNHIGSTPMTHKEPDTAIAEAQSYVQAHLAQRRKW